MRPPSNWMWLSKTALQALQQLRRRQVSHTVHARLVEGVDVQAGGQTGDLERFTAMLCEVVGRISISSLVTRWAR